jgi:glycosyltransferase involved in cell wall biosynthesis
MESKRKAVIVLGMHRSGTSALTRVLSLAGLALPQHLLQPNVDNEKGFWESDVICNCQDEFLEKIGSSWDDPRPIGAHIYESSIAKNFEKDLERVILEEFDQSPLFVIKDPRICRLLPLWIRVFKTMDIDPYFVLTIRHPDEVAASLFKRNQFSHEKSLALWCTHTLEAERETRGYPRIFTRYDTLLQDWKSVLLDAQTTLNLPLFLDGIDDEVTAFLSEDLRHNRAKDHNHLPQWAQELLEGFKENNAHRFDAIRIQSDNGALLQGCTYLEGKVQALDAENTSRLQTIQDLEGKLTEETEAHQLLAHQYQALIDYVHHKNVDLRTADAIFKKMYKNPWRKRCLRLLLGKTMNRRIRRWLRNANLGDPNFADISSGVQYDALTENLLNEVQKQSYQKKLSKIRFIGIINGLLGHFKRDSGSASEETLPDLSRAKVSIVLATYNGEKYLREQLDSLLSQSHKNIEILIGDDQSTDGTVSIVKEYQKNHPFIHVYQHEHNLGCDKNFEFLCSKAEGDYIAFSDQDDLWHQDKIKNLLQNIGECDLAYGPSQLVNRDGFDLGKTLLQRNGISPVEGRLIKFLMKHNTVSGHAMLCKASFIKQNLPIQVSRINGHDDIFFDYYFALCANFQNGIKYVPDAITFHRMHENNLTNNKNLTQNKNGELNKNTSRRWARKSKKNTIKRLRWSV